MKRATIVLTTAILLVVALVWQGTATVIDFSQKHLPYAESIQALLDREDYQAALEIVKDIQDLWKSDRKRLAIYIDHKHLDSIQQNMSSIKASCEAENADAATYCAALIDLLTHIPDMNRLWIENFL